MGRAEVEKALGRLVHASAIQQNVVKRESEKAAKIQNEVNKANAELDKFDNAKNETGD